ncbi:MAG: hypothetical protein HY015_06495 [Bacteroidetes bacterium]|nr:hypothetical protein [Bacteroidota bacterium]MBI3482613.1 hypothetical protein [Bacteroidota bacterium]
MKVLRSLLSVAVLGSMIAFTGCGSKGGNQEPLSDKQLGLLSKTWKVKDVLLGGADSTSHWSNFKLTIAGTKGQPTSFTYTCTGRPPRSVWPASGTWTFGDGDPSTPDDPATQILRDDGAQITYTVDPASANLQLRFTFSGAGYTRVNNVSGAWTFDLIPN